MPSRVGAHHGRHALVCLLLFGSAVLVAGCSRSSPTPTPIPPPATAMSGFVDVAAEAGLDFRMQFLPLEQGETFKINLYDHGCGIAVGDYDGDGDDDIYLLNQLGGNGLFRNRGDATFEDVTAEVGVALADRISVGATFSDYDNDGDQDLFVTSTRGGNVLFRNEGQGRLVEATDEAGLKHVGHSQTPAFFDYDNDGWLDLYLVQTAAWTTDAYDEQSRYFVGKGELGRFADVLASPVEKNILYRNNQDGTFRDVTDETGLAGRGWAGDVAVFDYDEDGWLDVLVTSMFGRAQLYRNQNGSRFEDVTMDTLGATPFGAIGAKVFDYNNDGRLDVYIVDMHSDMWMGVDFQHQSLELARENQSKRFDYFFGPYYDTMPELRSEELRVQDMLGYERDEVVFGNAFFENLGGGKFEEKAIQAGLETFWPWGIAAGDFDNNGTVDVFLTAGMGYPFYYWPNYLLMNLGHERFVESASTYGVEPPRDGAFLKERIADQDVARSSRCATTADFDGDGRLEIIVNNFNHEPYFLKNEFPEQNYVAFRLTGKQSNRDAIGARVKLTLGGNRTLLRQVHAAGGYLSHSSKTLHFGLGESETVERVEIHWPRGHVQTLDNLQLNQLHEVTEPETAAGE